MEQPEVTARRPEDARDYVLIRYPIEIADNFRLRQIMVKIHRRLIEEFTEGPQRQDAQHPSKTPVVAT